MQKILVPTDFSEFANTAKDYAVSIAKATGATIYFEHTMLVAVDWENMNESDRLLYPDLKRNIEEAENGLKDLVESVKREGVEAEQWLTFNEGLIDTPGEIHQFNFDLAVMGSHGETGLRSVLLGSNAQRMIRYAPCPVLIVKNRNEQPRFNQIAFASNFEELAHDSFDTIASFAKAMNAKMSLLYINTPVTFETSDQTQAKLESFQEKHTDVVDGSQIFNHYTEDEGIMKYMEQSQADILAIVTHGRKGWQRVFSGSITESLVAYGNFPILSVNMNVPE